MDEVKASSHELQAICKVKKGLHKVVTHHSLLTTRYSRGFVQSLALVLQIEECSFSLIR